MKKFFLLVPVAALAMTACTSESNEFVGDSQEQAREIKFSPLVQKATRAAVDGTTFPTTNAIQIAAYDATNPRDFFTPTEFTYSGASTIWTGSKYWPFSAATINFLAYTGFQGTAGSETDGATWAVTPATAKASGVTLVMTDNKTAQKDLMYACGTGTVSQSSNTLTFPENVPMVFKHAQAWITFNADAYDATTGGKVTLNSITLNGAKYNGTFTVTHNNYDKTKAQRDADASNTGSVSGVWSAWGSPQDVPVPGWESTVINFDGSGDGQAVGVGLMIVPDEDSETADFGSFTINYTLDSNTYNYTYTPTSRNVDKAKKYTYNIVFKLHEILINASIADWEDVSPTGVTIQE